MKVYISGKITGTDMDMTRRRFYDAESLIDSIGGLDAVNPMAETFPDSMTWQDIMLVDIRKLFNCDAIYMMNGWQDSTGAKIEYGIALQMHMTILFESNMIRNNTESLRIQAAIHEVTGLRHNQYVTNSRKREFTYARMLFCHHCRASKMKITKIAKSVHRSHSSVLHFLAKYDDEVKFNPAFQQMAERVDAILNKND